MTLEWTHDRCSHPGCTECTDCEAFPTVRDRLTMAQAAYDEYAEADSSSVTAFALDVLLLAQSKRRHDKALLSTLATQAQNEWQAYLENLDTPEAVMRRYRRITAHIIAESLGYATPTRGPRPSWPMPNTGARIGASGSRPAAAATRSARSATRSRAATTTGAIWRSTATPARSSSARQKKAKNRNWQAGSDTFIYIRRQRPPTPTASAPARWPLFLCSWSLSRSNRSRNRRQGLMARYN